MRRSSSKESPASRRPGAGKRFQKKSRNGSSPFAPITRRLAKWLGPMPASACASARHVFQSDTADAGETEGLQCFLQLSQSGESLFGSSRRPAMHVSKVSLLKAVGLREGTRREGKRNEIPMNYVGQDLPDDHGRSRTAAPAATRNETRPRPDSVAQLAQLGEGRCLWQREVPVNPAQRGTS